MTDERMPQPADSPTAEPVRPDDADDQAAAATAPAGGAGPHPAAPAAQPALPAAQPVPPASAAGPRVEAASPDVDLAQDASPLPGAHRGGFQRLPTAPVAVTVESAPSEPGGEFTPDATSWDDSESDFSRGLAGWALAFAIIGLLVSLFVGWGFPIGLVAIVTAIIALRRPQESRAVAVWAIVLGTVSILYSAGWLLFAAYRANLFG